MTITLKKESTVADTYKIAGDNLAEVYKNILKKGPKDPNDGKKVAGLTTTKLYLRITDSRTTFAPDGPLTIDSKGKYVAKAKLKAMNAVFTSETKLPEITSQKLSAKGLLEWIRFKAKLMLHEAGHIIQAGKESEKIIKEVDKMRGNGVGDTEKDAARNAFLDLSGQIVKKYSDANMDKRFKDVHKKFDKPKKNGKPGHGPVLNTAIP